MRRVFFVFLFALFADVSGAALAEEAQFTSEEREALGNAAGDIYVDMQQEIDNALNDVESINEESLRELAEAWMILKIKRQWRQAMRQAQKTLRKARK
ncbi:MAG: hypothetical protein KDD55_10150 [Bdellovibrionales bacterium]|nr:hypothetical protein [Bdellovibrionales bacterium]